MPIYEYECRRCCHKFEMRRHFGEDGGAVCPACQGRADRVFVPVPIIFKGSGFYVTDSRKPGFNLDESREKSAAGTPDTKAAKP